MLARASHEVVPPLIPVRQDLADGADSKVIHSHDW